jgi:hypothetical protein
MRHTAAALLALLVGCGEEASIGSTSCTLANACQSLTVDTPLTLTNVATRGLPTLEPAAWASTGETRLQYGAARIASAPEGGVWLFNSEGATLVASRLDAAGNLVDEQRLSSPIPDAAYVAFSSVQSHAQGPLLAVDWTPECGGSGSRPVACGKKELLVFSNELGAPPVRIDASSLYRPDHSVSAAFRSQDGNGVFIPTLKDGFSLIDLRGRQVWKQKLPSELARNDILLASLGDPDESAALDADGALLLNVNWFWEQSAGAASWRGVLYRQPADGGKGLVLQYTVPASDDAFRVKQGYWSYYARDPRGRHLVAHETEDGDVVVLRLDDTRADGFRLTRDDYPELALDATAMDPGGTFHVALNGGGRVVFSPQPILCSFPLEGAPTCSQLENRPGGMQAPAPGLVLINGPGGFTRYVR